MKKVFKYLILPLIAIVIVALTAASFFMLDVSLKPRHMRTYQEWYDMNSKNYPFIHQWVDSLQSHNAVKDTFVVFPDKRNMHALYLQAPHPTEKTAILIHGYSDNATMMFSVGYIYHHLLGYNLLMPDLNSHGKSDGTIAQMGWKDRLDVIRWMKIANGIFSLTDSITGKTIDTRQIIHGISMGAATTMCISGEANVPYVKAFVEDCGYTSVWDEFSGELTSMFDLPTFPLLYTTSALCKLRYGWTFGEASPLKQVAKCHLPMLFIHGDSDNFVPTWMVHPLYEAKPEPKELWLAPGSAHARSFADHPDEYIAHVKAFAERYLP